MRAAKKSSRKSGQGRYHSEASEALLQMKIRQANERPMHNPMAVTPLKHEGYVIDERGYYMPTPELVARINEASQLGLKHRAEQT